MPKVSVISAAYNHEKYVSEAIGSVLDQTFEDFELIVTDDASTDGTVEQICQFSDPRLKFLRNETNQGCSPTFNRCFANSSGKYIAWLGTDDAFEKHMLSTLVDYLDRNPDKQGVFGLARIEYRNLLFEDLNIEVCVDGKSALCVKSSSRFVNESDLLQAIVQLQPGSHQVSLRFNQWRVPTATDSRLLAIVLRDVRLWEC